METKKPEQDTLKEIAESLFQKEDCDLKELSKLKDEILK